LLFDSFKAHVPEKLVWAKRPADNSSIAEDKSSLMILFFS
jgi:hypothetical protein